MLNKQLRWDNEKSNADQPVDDFLSRKIEWNDLVKESDIISHRNIDLNNHPDVKNPDGIAGSEPVDTNKKYDSSIDDFLSGKIEWDDFVSGSSGRSDITSEKPNKYLKAFQNIFGEYADIPLGFIKGATWEYAPTVETPKEAGIWHQIATGAAHLAGLGVGLLPVTKAMQAAGLLVKTPGIVSGILRGLEMGGIYGAGRAKREDESRIKNAIKDGIMFGLFEGGGGAIESVLSHASPTVKNIFKKIAEGTSLTKHESKIYEAVQAGRSVALGAGAGATQPAETPQEWLRNVAIGAGTFGVVHYGSKLIPGRPDLTNIEKPKETITPQELVINIIDSGLESGELDGMEFTPEHAIGIIKESHNSGIFSDADLETLKTKYPSLKPGINDIIADSIKKKLEPKIDETLKNISRPDIPPEPVLPESVPPVEAKKPEQTKPKAVPAEQKGEGVGDVEFEKQAEKQAEKQPKVEPKIKPGDVFDSPIGKIKFDGVYEGFNNIPTRYAYTIQDGPAQGTSFATESDSMDAIIKKAEKTVKSFAESKKESTEIDVEKEIKPAHKITQDDLSSHLEEIKQALSEGKLTPEEYDKIHAKDYGKYGSEEFKKNFPDLKTETKSAETKSAEGKPSIPPEKTKIAPKERSGGGIAILSPNEINVDPQRFQYKRGMGKGGVSSKLKNVKKFDPELGGIISVWRDKDGKIYVVNGHHRLELAKRTGTKEITVRFLKADSAKEAKTKGALINIAENQGTPEDAAEIFRSEKITPQELEDKYNISLKGEIARKGAALSKLNPLLFSDVLDGKFPQNQGVVIGENLDNHEAQAELYKFIKREKKKGRNINAGIIEQIIKDMSGMAKTKEEQVSLFGTESFERPLLLERAELRDYVVNKLAADKRLFKVVSDASKAKRLTAAGNIINIKRSKTIAEQAAIVREVFDRLSGSKGEINDLLNEYAERLSNATGQSKQSIKQGFLDRVREIVPQLLTGKKKRDVKRGGTDAKEGTLEHSGEESIHEGLSIFESKEPKQQTLFDDTSIEAKTKKARSSRKIKRSKKQAQLNLFTDEQEHQIQKGLFDTFIKFIKKSFGLSKPSDIYKPNKSIIKGADRWVYNSPNGRIFEAPSMTVKGPGDVASILSDIGSLSREGLFSVTVDKDGKILEIYEHSRGTKNSSPFHPVEIGGHIFNIPDADAVYIVHNHPAGSLSDSRADYNSVDFLSKILALKGIDTNAFIIAGDKWKGFGKSFTVEKTIKPITKKEKIKVMESVIKGTVGEKIDNSTKLRKLIKDKYNNKEGIVFFDTGLHDLGFLPWPEGISINKASAQIIAAAEGLNASGYAINLNKPLNYKNRQSFISNFIRTFQEHGLPLFDILEKGKSYSDEGIIWGLRGTDVGNFEEISKPDILFSSERQKAQMANTYKSLAKSLNVEDQSKESINKAIGRVVAELRTWKHFPATRLIKNESELSKRLRRQVDFYSKKIGKRVEGIYDKETDQVILIHSNISEDRLIPVLKHEAMGHRGFRLFYGDDLNKAFLDPLSKAKKAEILADNPDLNWNDKDAVRRAAEEWAASKLEKDQLPVVWYRRLIRAFREWLRKFIPNLKMTDEEIKDTLAEIARNVREGERDRLRISAEVNRFAQPVSMSLKKAVKTITDNPNFKKWFGKSKVVDENGEPLVVYHYTAVPQNFTVFKRGDLGSHFGTQNQANTFADLLSTTSAPKKQRIYPVYLRIRNPLRLQDLGAFDVKSVAPQLVEKGILKKEDIPTNLADMSLEQENEFLVNAIEKAGYDGVVYLNRREGINNLQKAVRISDKMSDAEFLKEFPEAEDSYIAFDPTQIKSIYNRGTFDPNNSDIRFSLKTPKEEDVESWAKKVVENVKLETSKKPATEEQGLQEETTPSRLKQTTLSILDGLDPRKTGVLRAVEKVVASPEWFQHPTQKKVVEAALDREPRYHEIFNEFNSVDDATSPYDTVTDALKALAKKGVGKLAFLAGKRSAEFKELDEILDEADINNEVLTEKDLAKKGYSKEVIDTWKLVRDSYDKQLDALLKPMQDMVDKIAEKAAFEGKEPVYPDFGTFIMENGKRKRLNLKEATIYMGQLRGSYSPRIRSKGDWAVRGVKKQIPQLGGDQYVREHASSRVQANLLRDELKRQGYTNLKVERVAKLTEDTFQALNVMEMGAAIEEAAKRGLDNYSPEMKMAFLRDVIMSAADVIKSRGYRSSMIRRNKSTVVKGYITDTLERYLRYTSNNAAGMAKSEAALKMGKALFGEVVNGKKVGGLDQTKEQSVYSTTRAYIQEQLRNPEAMDRAIALAKSLTTFKYLGFNPRSVLVNVSSLGTSVPVALHEYVTKGKGSLIKIGLTLSKATKDYAKVMAGKTLKDNDEMRFVLEFKNKGYDQAQYVRDAMGVIRDAYGTAWAKAMSGSMFVFGKSEQWIRGTTALAGYRLGRKMGLSHVEAAKRATEATSKAHGTYNKATNPSWTWGKGLGRLGQSFYTYMKFPHNYIQMLYDVGVRKKNMKAVIYGMAAPAVLSGVAAIPMYATVMAFANEMLSILGYDNDAEKLVYDTIKEQLGEKTEEAVRSGVLGAMGIDISSSLAMGPGEIPTSLLELTGAVGGAYKDIVQAGRYAELGEYGKAAEKALPTAASNILRAIREVGGVVTARGYRVWDENGNPYIPTKSETIKRGLGFRSTRQKLLSERVWLSKREEARFAKRRNFIYQQMRTLILNPDNEKLKRRIANEISRFNIAANKTQNVPLITPASFRRQEGRLLKPTTKERGRIENIKYQVSPENIWSGVLGLTKNMDNVQAEIKRLTDSGELKYPSMPARSIQLRKGERIDLTSEQYNDYVKKSDAMAKERLDKIIMTDEWKRATDKKKAFVVERIIRKSRAAVRKKLRRKILKGV